MSQKIVSIVVTYNGASWITRCLTSLQNSAYPTHIIVVDNASTDNSCELVKKFSSAKLIELHDNVGFGKANNIGIRHALDEGAGFIFLLNQDAWIVEDTLGKLVDIANTTPNLGILSPLHWNHGGSALDKNFAHNLFKGSQAKDLDELIAQTNNSLIREISFVNAAIWLLPRSSIEQFGGFDPIFFMYGEDDDYCQRVLWHGQKIVVALNARAYHARGTTISRENFWKKLRRYQSRTRAMMLVLLKNPNHAYTYNLYRILYYAYRSTLGAIKTWDIAQLLGIWIAQIFILLELTKVHEHRKLSMTRGMHWLAK